MPSVNRITNLIYMAKFAVRPLTQVFPSMKMSPELCSYPEEAVNTRTWVEVKPSENNSTIRSLFQGSVNEADK